MPSAGTARQTLTAMGVQGALSARTGSRMAAGFAREGRMRINALIGVPRGAEFVII